MPHIASRKRSSSGLVVSLERRDRLVVEPVERRRELVVDPVLPFAHQPDDHDASLPRAPSRLVAGAELGLELRQLVVDLRAEAEICASSRSSAVSPVVVKSSSAPASTSSSTAAARACMSSVLSFARWIARPDVGHLLADAARRLADLDLRLGAPSTAP